MKTFFLIALAFTCYRASSQCSNTQTIGLLVSTQTTVAFTDPFCIKVCAAGLAYDTTGNAGRIYYLEAGAKLKLKMNSTTVVYMKASSSLTVVGNGSTVVYRETGATVTGTAATQNTCAVVQFPASPACVATGIKEQALSGFISTFPVPAKDYLTLNVENYKDVSVAMINALGESVRSFNLMSESSSINIADLGSGIYYLRFSEKNRIIATHKVIVVK